MIGSVASGQNASNRPTASRRWLTLGVTAFALAALAAPGAFAKAPKSEDEKTLYFIGVVMSRNFNTLDLSPDEVDMVIQGLQDSLKDQAVELDEEAYRPKLEALVKARTEAAVEREKEKTKEFLAKAAKAKGAKTTESGLIFTEVKGGSGDSPAPTDTVKVHYHGTLSDGTVFDSSVDRGQPFETALNRVIPCWTEGVTMMKPGGKAKLICPPEIAYGDRGAPPVIPGGAALTFEVELIEVK